MPRVLRSTCVLHSNSVAKFFSLIVTVTGGFREGVHFLAASNVFLLHKSIYSSGAYGS